MTPSVLRGLLDVAASQHSVFAAAQALSLGASYDNLRCAVDAGWIVRRLKGVYQVAGAPITFRSELWLAHLAVPGSVISHSTAARIHGFRGFDHAGIELTVNGGGNHHLSTGRLHETYWLPSEHVTIIEGLPVTTVARTVFDLAGTPKHPESFRNPGLREAHVKWVAWLLNEALGKHGLTYMMELAVLVETGKRGKPGTAIIREVLLNFGPDYVPIESDLEWAVLDLITSAGLPSPERQVEVGTGQQRIGRVDFVYRRQGLLIEVDGKWHDTPLQKRIDRLRDEQARGDGWTVIRISWRDLIESRRLVVLWIREELATAA